MKFIPNDDMNFELFLEKIKSFEVSRNTLVEKQAVQ